MTITFMVLIAVVLFNLSYFSNSGLLVAGLKRAKKINYLNASAHSEIKKGPLSLSTFRMEEFLNQSDANELALQVMNDPMKKRRNAAMSTVGTASYLDGSDKNEYERLSSLSNPHMSKNYRSILQKVLKYFRARTNAKVEYRNSAALPGFHIFDCNKLFSMPVASVHKDMQFLRLKMGKEEKFDMENTMSFTLALQLPEDGAGLYTFDSVQLPSILHHLVPHPLIHSFANKTKIEYKEGWIVTHGGQTYHMIAPCNPSPIHRVTLQGHGVYDEKANTWWLYW